MSSRLRRFDRLGAALELVESPKLHEALREYERAGEAGARAFVEQVAHMHLSAAREDGAPPERTERAQVGAGFAGTLRFACLGLQERERTIVFAAGDEPWSARGDLRMGQRVGELACARLPVDVLDLTKPDEVREFCPAVTFGVALRLSQLSMGMRFYRGTLDFVAVDAGGTVLQFRDSSVRVWTQHLDLALGLGPPRRMRARVVPDWDIMHAAGTALYAEEALLADRSLRGRVAIGSAGLTAAWVAEKALRGGCSEVWLLGTGNARWPDERARAAAASNGEFQHLLDTKRTARLLSAIDGFGPDTHRVRLVGIDNAGQARGEFHSGSYVEVRSADGGVRVVLDDGTTLVADCFVSAAGQDNGWRPRDAPGLFDRPPMAALGLRKSDWSVTAARDGAPVGVNDPSERRRVIGADGTRAADAVRPRRCRSPELVVDSLVKRSVLPGTGRTADGVPYQNLAVRTHGVTPHGELAPDGLALVNLGTENALSRAELTRTQSREVLSVRARLERSAAAEDEEPDAFTSSDDHGPLPRGWWSFEDFERQGLSAGIVDRLSRFEPSRGL